jgi:amino acid transporter
MPFVSALSLFWSYIGNGLMAIVFLIVYVFSIDDVDAAINDPTGYPFIYVFKSAMNTAGVNALTIIVLFIVTAANINFGASTARQTFAFARDKGLPGWRWISKVDREKEIPANAVLVTSAFTILLSLINIGSETAFNAIISLQVVSLMCTYATSISCVLYRRIKHPDLMPVARWSLGKWGVPINIIGFLYSVYSFFWSFWPGSKTTTAEDFNWAIVIFLCVFALCLVMYYVKGRKIYEGPVTSVRMARLSI